MTRALRRRPYAVCSAVLWLAALAGSGWIACIGFGTVDFTMLPHADLYVGGTAKPVNLDADAVLILRDGAEWTESVSCTVLERSGEPSAYVRLGRSAILKGVVER